MDNKLKQLKNLVYEIYDLEGAQSVLGWDQQTYMPKRGSAARSNQLATLASLVHKKSTSDEMGSLLEDLSAQLNELNPESVDYFLINNMKEKYDREKLVSTDWVTRYAQTTGEAHMTWQEAREKGDFSIFQSHLEQIVELVKEYSEFYKPYDHVYEPLLYNFEPGMKTREILDIFAVLRKEQVELIKEIRAKEQVEDGFLYKNFSVDSQWDFGVEVITKFGYDWQRGRQDKAAHPFTTSFDIDDVRITTRLHNDYVGMGMFGTMHECGHALYELGIDRSLRRTPLAHGASAAIHESQSRMYENLVGRSLPFWKHFYPKLQNRFSEQLGNVDLMTFYKGINRVEPSLIRVEADEATYNLHIMLRMEIEIGLLDGTINVADLPEIWDQKMEEYLGIQPKTVSFGVLQDVHWSSGLFGYFPSYALGNLVSSQLWELFEKDHGNWQQDFENGNFANLLNWLIKNVHSYGAKYKPGELMKKITGTGIDPKPFIKYLRTKYGEIYNL